MKTPLFLAVRSILNRHDIAGVIMDDAVVDEYDSETNDIVLLLDNKIAQSDLAVALRNIFIKWFDEKTAGGLERYNQMATEITALLRVNVGSVSNDNVQNQ